MQATLDALAWQALVLDLAGLRFIDSSGIGLLVQVRNECEVSMRRLQLHNVSEGARRIFDLTGVTDLFDLA